MTEDSTQTPAQPPDTSPTRSGNRCGHDPARPRWFAPPADHHERPSIIREWIERARQFYEKPDKIPSLAGALLGRKLAADPAGDHKPRQMRSERREACCDLLGSIAHYCDLPSLCLSVPQTDGSLRPLKFKTLADRAGLSLRRAERAMRDIVDAGLIGVYPRCELQDDGTYIGRAAIRAIPTSFFGLFGLEERLEHDRKRISQKRAEARGNQPPTRTATARIKTAVNGVLNRLTGRGGKPVPAVPAATTITEAPPTADLPHSGHIADMLAILAGEPTRRGEGDRGHQDQAAAAPRVSFAGERPAKGSHRGGHPQGP